MSRSTRHLVLHTLLVGSREDCHFSRVPVSTGSSWSSFWSDTPGRLSGTQVRTPAQKPPTPSGLFMCTNEVSRLHRRVGERAGGREKRKESRTSKLQLRKEGVGRESSLQTGVPGTSHTTQQDPRFLVHGATPNGRPSLVNGQATSRPRSARPERHKPAVVNDLVRPGSHESRPRVLYRQGRRTLGKGEKDAVRGH